MGYAHYEITRNGETIQAGYGIETVCEKDNCREVIDRGLGHLCGQTPGGDEHGCGGYFCGQHLLGDNQCETCSAAANEANRWVHPDTGEEFDLRDYYLPAGAQYDPRGTVWQHLGAFDEGAPLLTPVYAIDVRPTGQPARPITDGGWEEAARALHRQLMAT